ncbi:MAG: B12-binding domain-containing protein, partial [Caldilineaceae bacterium]|nr:B12-binding domain-containing protein [Caldilineaceae bacterium]
MSEEEIILSELSLEDLYELMKEDLYDGLADEIVEEVNEALSRDQQPYEVLTSGLVAGMEIVGNDFRDGILFVPEVLMAAKAMKAGMAILRPLLAETGAEKIGT